MYPYKEILWDPRIRVYISLKPTGPWQGPGALYIGKIIYILRNWENCTPFKWGIKLIISFKFTSVLKIQCSLSLESFNSWNCFGKQSLAIAIRNFAIWNWENSSRFAIGNGAYFRPQFEESDCSEPNRDMGFSIYFDTTKLQFMHKQAKTWMTKLYAFFISPSWVHDTLQGSL